MKISQGCLIIVATFALCVLAGCCHFTRGEASNARERQALCKAIQALPARYGDLKKYAIRLSENPQDWVILFDNKEDPLIGNFCIVVIKKQTGEMRVDHGR